MNDYMCTGVIRNYTVNNSYIRFALKFHNSFISVQIAFM